MTDIQHYNFEDWIPEKTQKMIANFWGVHDGADGWRRDQKVQGETDFSHHGPNPNGFGLPPHGATVEYFVKDWPLSKKHGREIFFILKGRYVHRWNNMGSLIDENGKDWTISTCERWVRWFASEDERNRVLNNGN